MRKFYAILAALTLSLTIGVTAMAQPKAAGKSAKKPGCSDCAKADVSPEQLRKFKLDTIDLRQEMMNKRFDLQRENLKETPDSGKVTAIEADIAAIKEKIEAKRKAANLPESFCNDRDCPLIGGGDCGKCGDAKACGCSCCKKAGSCATCKDCKNCSCCKKGGDCAACKDCKECKNCRDGKDCGCSRCGKKADCSKCNNKKKQPAKAGCRNCNK